MVREAINISIRIIENFIEEGNDIILAHFVILPLAVAFSVVDLYSPLFKDERC